MGARFSAPVQTGPDAYPGTCTMGAGTLPGVGVKRPWLRRDRAALFSAKVANVLELCPPPISWGGHYLPFEENERTAFSWFACFQASAAK